MNKALVAVLLILGLFACTREDEIINDDTSVKLRFSQDTLTFDTLLTTVGSISKKIRVYNDDDNAVKISSINLNTSSPYQLIVNGKKTKSQSDILLLGKDSLLLIVNVTLDPNSQNIPYLIRDSIVFETNTNIQDIKLEAWGRDAHFLKSGELEDCETIWENDKAYVITDSLVVKEGCSLNIKEGCHILFNYGAKLVVNGTLNVEGSADSLVRFFNDNDLSVFKDDALGYWRGIEFGETTKNNSITYAHIQNAFYGLSFAENIADSVFEIQLKNVQISQMLNNSIEGKTFDLVAENCLFSNSLNHLLDVDEGGNYHFTHCTFAHLGSGTKQEAIETNGGKLTLINSIVWGTSREELSVEETESYFLNNFIRTEQEGLDNQNTLNEDPMFVAPSLLNYSLDSLSLAVNILETKVLEQDLKGNSRDDLPDIGALEFIPNVLPQEE
ncbi:MAG: hypothetical protein GY827_02510 [Cytophagales bacterium]|nr:hypothetical protein [Cytophagales bacterium]